MFYRKICIETSYFLGEKAIALKTFNKSFIKKFALKCFLSILIRSLKLCIAYVTNFITKYG